MENSGKLPSQGLLIKPYNFGPRSHLLQIVLRGKVYSIIMTIF